jgi:hypothetical protein
MTLEHLHQRYVAAERRAILAELDAIEAALDVFEQRFGADAVITETRTQAVRVQWLAVGPTVVH